MMLENIWHKFLFVIHMKGKEDEHQICREEGSYIPVSGKAP